MTGWVEILVVSFVLQLSVLPGEKVQFIIAGLATKYDPWIVVAAAGTAFAGWTVVEILFGAAVQGTLAPVYLDAITAALFLLFAVLLVRSAPDRGGVVATTNGETAETTNRDTAETTNRDTAETTNGDTAETTTDVITETKAIDVSIRGYRIPPYLRGFVPIFALMVVGEFGDKTQLVTIGLAVQYGAHPAIWLGEMLAIIPISIVNALFFHRFAHRFNARLAHLAGATLFVFFGGDTVLQIVTGFSIWEAVVGRVASAILVLV